jgi:hypothetical protein
MVALELLPMVVVVAAKVAEVAAAETVTDAEAVRVELVLVRETLAPPVGAGWVKVTVQVLEAFCPRLVGLQASEETRTGATRLRVVLAELLLYVAVMVALELLPMVVVVALKVAEVAAAETLTDAGTVRVELVFVRVTLAPPVGAGWVNVSVQVLEAFCPRLVGLQASEETRTGATRLRVALAELLLYVAVMVALELLPIIVVVAPKVAEVAAAATVTEAGTVRVELVFVRVTLAPPVGAGWVKVTVQVLEAFCPRLAGLQASEETRTGATRLTVVLAELPL